VDLLDLENKADTTTHQQALSEGKTMGGSNVDVSKIPQVDSNWQYPLLASKREVGATMLQGQGETLLQYAKTPPKPQVFDTERVSREASEFGLQNKFQSQEIEKLISPETARMRDEMGGRVALLTDIEASKQSMDDWAKSRGLMSGFSTGIGAGTIGRSAMYDATTEAGKQARLRNLAIQQGYLAQTPAPIGGLDPATAIQAEMQAKSANLEAMQRYQQNVFQGGQKLQQSTSDWINQNLGELQQANQVDQQNKQQREQMMYDAAVQNAASQNAMTGTLIGAGGAVAGAALGAAIIV
jgi:hypothetical protein